MRPALKLIQCGPVPQGPLKLVCMNDSGERRIITVEEREVAHPRISMLLHGFYHLDDVIEIEGEPHVTATLSFIWRAEKRTITGIVVPSIGDSALLLPVGSLE